MYSPPKTPFFDKTRTGWDVIVHSLKVIKAYVREQKTVAEFGVVNGELKQAATRAQILTAFMGPTMNLVNNLSLAAVAGVGGYLALRGLATVGTIAAFVSYARRFTRPLNMLAQLYNTFQAALAGA